MSRQKQQRQKASRVMACFCLLSLAGCGIFCLGILLTLSAMKDHGESREWGLGSGEGLFDCSGIVYKGICYPNACAAPDHGEWEKEYDPIIEFPPYEDYGCAGRGLTSVASRALSVLTDAPLFMRAGITPVTASTRSTSMRSSASRTRCEAGAPDERPLERRSALEQQRI